MTTAPYTVSWNTSSASSGTHTLSARARDAAGNQRTSTAISVTVANGALSVSLTAPASGSSFEAGSTVGLAATASSAGGSVTKVQFFAGATKIGRLFIVGFQVTGRVLDEAGHVVAQETATCLHR